MSSITPFAQLLQTYFHDWLITQRGASRHTILAYRDTWRLFLRFVAARTQQPVARLELSHLTAAEVLAFLAYLDRLGIFIFRLPGSPRDSRVREASEGASVKADEGVD